MSVHPWLDAPLTIATCCLLLLLLALGIPPSDAEWGLALGQGNILPTGLWHLWHSSGPFWQEGLSTRLLLFPEGQVVWPHLLVEGTILSPIVHFLGAARAALFLHFARIWFSGMGAALLMRRLGLNGWWGALVVLSPAAMQALSAGSLEAGSVYWLPWALLALTAPPGNSWKGVVLGLLATLAMGTSWLTALATLIALAVLRPRAFLRLPAIIAMLLLAAAMAFRHLALPQAFGDLSAQTPGESCIGGDLKGFLGLGIAPRWGGLLLATSCLGFFPRAGIMGRRGVLLVLAGTLFAIGPTLCLDGEPIPLDRSLLALPLFPILGFFRKSSPEFIATFGVLCWLGLAVLLGSFFRHRAWSFLALATLSTGTWPRWSALPEPAIEKASGPVLTYPLEADARWSLYDQTIHGQPTSAGLDSAGPSVYLKIVDSRFWNLWALEKWARAAGFAHFAIDLSADHGRVSELAGTLGGSVTDLDGSRQWPDKQWLSQRFVYSAESIDPPPTASEPQPAWDDWLYRNPALEPLLEQDSTGEGFPVIWSYTSSDAQTWHRLPEPSARYMTTLGLGVVDDEVLMISGLLYSPPQVLSVRHPAYFPVLFTQDLLHWGIRWYALDAPVSIIDPELSWEDGRLWLTAWTLDKLRRSEDPVLSRGDHRVVRASLAESGFFENPRVIFKAPGVGDPVMVDGLLYMTQTTLKPRLSTRVVVAANKEGRFIEVGEVPGISVPCVWRDGDTWRMYAQGWSRGKAIVVQSESEDGIHWEPPRELPGLGRCRSPVATRFKGQDILVCSEAPPDSGQALENSLSPQKLLMQSKDQNMGASGNPSTGERKTPPRAGWRLKRILRSPPSFSQDQIENMEHISISGTLSGPACSRPAKVSMVGIPAPGEQGGQAAPLASSWTD